MCSASDLFLGLLAILFPPIAVWIKLGIFTLDSLLNILLSTLGYLPGLLHAWYVIAKFPDDDGGESSHARGGYSQLDEERGVTYYYVERRPGGSAPGGGAHHGYGTVAPPAALTMGNQSAGGPPQGGAGVRGQETMSGGVGDGGEGGSAEGAGQKPPPTYAQAIKGDNKVQSGE
ncbi:MAG: hypothetical protein M1833_006963 [Piccolia ochrophora]|nr:MAG: hypothetical protein M1833_006963 [Piccolia ochrophora]